MSDQAVGQGEAGTSEYSHHRTPMGGRDIHERDRSATPLELLYDLVFVVAFGVAGAQLAHGLAAGHLVTTVSSFLFVMFAVVWAWINYAWFASAYDTDDWVCRVLAMVQMGGVALLALGIPAIFHSIEAGDHLDNAVLVMGYVVMRVALIGLWLRARAADPGRRAAIMTYVTTLAVAQIGWVVLVFVSMPIAPTVVCMLLLVCVELLGPVIGERKAGTTPWQAHHIAERYSCMAIIALGEGVVGTIGSLALLVDSDGWTVDAVLLLVSGIGLTVGMWWTYFMLPSAEVLHAHRERAFGWGYGHMPVFWSIAAVGAGLHVASYYLDPQEAGFEVHVSAVGTVLTVAVPLTIYLAGLYTIYWQLTRVIDPLHAALMGGTLVIVAGAVLLAWAGLPVAWCLLVLALAPVVTIVGYELAGHQHKADLIASLQEAPTR